MSTTEILVVLGCGGLFVLLGWLTRDRPSSLLQRPESEGSEPPRAGRCGPCRTPCEMSESQDA